MSSPKFRTEDFDVHGVHLDKRLVAPGSRRVISRREPLEFGRARGGTVRRRTYGTAAARARAENPRVVARPHRNFWQRTYKNYLAHVQNHGRFEKSYREGVLVALKLGMDPALVSNCAGKSQSDLCLAKSALIEGASAERRTKVNRPA